MALAEALFDNDSEWPDELGFSKGEMLRVMDQKPAGGLAEGWWLCSDKEGRRGIAPANRLRLIHPPHFPPQRVITPRRFGDLFLYNNSERNSPQDGMLLGDAYDVPHSIDRLRLFHGSEQPLRVSNERTLGDGPVVREVPIRVEGRSRRSPPPPPQRKYFHHFSSTGGSSSEAEESNRGGSNHYDDPQKAKQDSGLLYPGGRSSNSSSISPTIPFGGGGGSERSSSLSESSQDPYDVPSSLRDSSSNGGGASKSSSDSSSVLMNILGKLYEGPDGGAFKSSSTLCGEDHSMSGGDSDTLRLRHGRAEPQPPAFSSLYDVPKGHAVVTSSSGDTPRSGSSGYASEQLPSDLERLSVSSLDSKDSDYQTLIEGVTGRSESPDRAVKILNEKLSAFETTIISMRTWTEKPGWRKRMILQETLPHIRDSVDGVLPSLDDFLQFATGALINLSALPDHSTAAKKLAHILRPLKDSQRILENLRRGLGKQGWSLAGLSREAPGAGNDQLDQFLAVARQIPEDCRQLAFFIITNKESIFGSQDVAAQNWNGVNGNGKGEWEGRVVEEHELESCDSSSDRGSLFDDYDFVDSLSADVKEQLPSKREETPTRESTNNHHQETFSPEDKQILGFYAAQVEIHMSCLSRAIEDFLSSIEESQPPPVFVGKSKLVVLAAHKLVYIGDSIAQCLKSSGSAGKIKEASDVLCAVLKDSVKATKVAASNFPTLASIQRMVDTMVNVSHQAHQLQLFIGPSRPSADPPRKQAPST